MHSRPSPSRLFAILAIPVLAFGLVGCGGAEEAAETTVEEAPSWMTETPSEEDYVFGAGTGVSGSYQMAIDKAETRAREDLASTLEVQVQSMTEDFQEEVGDEYLNQFTQTTRTVVNQTLQGTQARETKVLEEEGRFRAYALMEMPIGKAGKELLSKMKGSEELYTRFRKSEAFDRLQEAIENYEE